ncbi:hypothetical protein LINPERPRIM_LOCUS15150 [Linum perenne]
MFLSPIIKCIFYSKQVASC